MAKKMEVTIEGLAFSVQNVEGSGAGLAIPDHTDILL